MKFAHKLIHRGASAPLLLTFAGPTTVHGDPRTTGFAFTALKRLSVRALKQKTKQKQTGTKFKGRGLHWPNKYACRAYLRQWIDALC